MEISDKELAFIQKLMDAEQGKLRINEPRKAPRPKASDATHDQWTDCTGTVFWVHRWKLECREGCAIHAPSQHCMRDLPQLMRESTLIERICTHGIGHPDPDSMRYFESVGLSALGVHGCDGCCRETCDYTEL